MITSVEGKGIKRVIAARLTPGEDLLLGIQAICEKHNILNGVILNGMGSLRNARFFNPVPIDTKVGYGYSDPMNLVGPIEIVSVTGMICHSDEDEILLHIHFSLSDQNGGGYGGHVIEGNIVLLTADIIIGELDGVDMCRRYDEELEVMLFAPQEIKE